MKHTYFIISALLILTRSAQAQLRVTAQDSVALFTTEADEYKASRELLRAKGRLTHVAFRPGGGITLSVLRQHVGYLRADKETGLRPGINILPALYQVGFAGGACKLPPSSLSASTAGCRSRCPTGSASLAR